MATTGKAGASKKKKATSKAKEPTNTWSNEIPAKLITWQADRQEWRNRQQESENQFYVLMKKVAEMSRKKRAAQRRREERNKTSASTVART